MLIAPEITEKMVEIGIHRRWQESHNLMVG